MRVSRGVLLVYIGERFLEDPLDVWTDVCVRNEHFSGHTDVLEMDMSPCYRTVKKNQPTEVHW